jgi:hypothetical protein
MYHETLLEYYLHIDTSKLDDYQWASKIAALDKIRSQEKLAVL